jgi:adenosine deaminase
VPLPSVLLHDHLDGGLRVGTIVDLADQLGYDRLPAPPDELGSWFDQSRSGSLEGYLDSFEHTIAVMQDEEGLSRVAYEAVVDLAKDGVVYAEIRFCPALHTKRGLSPDAVVAAVASGMRAGAAETGLYWGLIIDALRQFDHAHQMAAVAASHRSDGVVGFDIAGPEAPFPPSSHLEAMTAARAAGLHLTVHAGEAGGANGVRYIEEALEVCGAERIGHGVQLIEDCRLENGEIVEMGAVARAVLDRQIPLEMCPASNLATGGITPERHPIGALYRAGFNVTINTDNRLMSTTSMPAEFEFVRTHHRFELDDLAVTTRRSLEAAFCPPSVKRELWEEVLGPSYQAAGAGATTWPGDQR